MGSGVHCIDSLYWFIVLVHCIGSLYWFIVLIPCIGSLIQHIILPQIGLAQDAMFFSLCVVLLCFFVMRSFAEFFEKGLCDSGPAGRPGHCTVCVCFCVPSLMSNENPKK